MSFRAYIIMMIITTLASWSMWAMVIFSINPNTTDFLGLLFFYLSLFLSLIGTMSIVGSVIRKKMIKEGLLFRHVVVSLRQAVLFSVLIITALLLQSNSILTWWSILLLVGALSVIELFSISKKRSV